MYPLPAASTDSINGNLVTSMIFAVFSAISRGFFSACLANSKHNEDANSPNSGVGG